MSKGWEIEFIYYDKCVGCMACNDMCKHGVYKPDMQNRHAQGCLMGSAAVTAVTAVSATVRWKPSITLVMTASWTSTMIMKPTNLS